MSEMSRPARRTAALSISTGAGVRRELAGHVVEHDVLEDQHRVRILQRGPQHAARVLERRRRQHLDAGNVRVPAFEAVRVLRRKLAPGAGRHADHQRHAELVARHVADRGGGIENLIEREQAEIDRHQLDDRPHAGHRGANAGAGEARFRQRRIADALGAELGEQSLAHRVAAAVAADVLAHQEDLVVAAQGIADRLAHGLAIGQSRSLRAAGHV